MNITTNCLSCDLNGKAECAAVCANCMHNNPAGKYNLHQPVLHTILMVNAEGEVSKFEGVYRTNATIGNIMLIDFNRNEMARFPNDESWAMIDLTPTIGWNESAASIAPESPQNAEKLTPALTCINGCVAGSCDVLLSTGLVTNLKWCIDSKIVPSSILAVQIHNERIPIVWNPEVEAYFLAKPD